MFLIVQVINVDRRLYFELLLSPSQVKSGRYLNDIRSCILNVPNDREIARFFVISNIPYRFGDNIVSYLSAHPFPQKIAHACTKHILLVYRRFVEVTRCP